MIINALCLIYYFFDGDDGRNRMYQDSCVYKHEVVAVLQRASKSLWSYVLWIPTVNISIIHASLNTASMSILFIKNASTKLLSNKEMMEEYTVEKVEKIL